MSSSITKKRSSHRTLRRHDAIHDLSHSDRRRHRSSRRTPSPVRWTHDRYDEDDNMTDHVSFDIRKMVLRTDGQRRRHLIKLQELYVTQCDDQSCFTSFAFLVRLSAIHRLYFPEESGKSLATRIESHECRYKKLSLAEMKILNTFEMCKLVRGMVTEASCLLFDEACKLFLEYRHTLEYDDYYN